MFTAERFSFALPLAFFAGAALLAGAAFAADGPGLGKKVSEADLALWDISVGPDGKNLPPGSGTAAQGAAIFAQKCEACHGKGGTGGSNSTLINAPGKSARTMALYVPNATTVFDFIRRAMPWPQPKSLTNEEAYALTAFILAGNKIIGENDAMNAETLPKVAMPNRNGFVSRYPEKH
jgi:S-disulfanyl-L-cysteine oxidoreductase SoxD